MKGKILIVDDQADYRGLLRLHLEDAYQIVEVESRASLQNAFAQEPADVVLLDVKLPDANGLIDLLPLIKERWPTTEVIILTGAPSDNEALPWAIEATKGGAFNFLRKGDKFDREKFLTDVSNAVDPKTSASARGSRTRNYIVFYGLPKGSIAPVMVSSSAPKASSTLRLKLRSWTHNPEPDPR